MCSSDLKKIKQWVHLGFALIFMLLVFGFKWYNNKSIVDLIFLIASLTYGPLLGLFAFGILTKRTLYGPNVIQLILISPIICYLLSFYSKDIFHSYAIGNELLIINGGLTFLILYLFSKKSTHVDSLKY